MKFTLATDRGACTYGRTNSDRLKVLQSLVIGSVGALEMRTPLPFVMLWLLESLTFPGPDAAGFAQQAAV